MKWKSIVTLFCVFVFILLVGVFFANYTELLANVLRPYYKTEFEYDNTIAKVKFIGFVLVFISISGNIYIYLQGTSPISIIIDKIISLFLALFPPSFRKRVESSSARRIHTRKINVHDDDEDNDDMSPSNQILNRLMQEIVKTRKNSNVNLVIGFFTTAIAVFILGYTVISIDASKEPQHYTKYIPRITLTFFIELFSFFFLRLYRKNLDDIKYLTNEITNIEAKMMAMEFIRNSEDKILQKTVIGEIVKTERNFILNKGQSTVELEKLKFDKDNFLEGFNKMLSIFTKQNKSS